MNARRSNARTSPARSTRSFARTATAASLAMAATLAAATPAGAGGCDWTLGNAGIGFVPDFDQIRQGFVNDGYAVCVPAAAVNWIAWLDGHGFPSVMPFAPMNWQSQSAFDEVSAAILEMASYMDTDHYNGTSWDGFVEGVETWLDTYADPDDFTVGFHTVNGAYAPPPVWAWTAAKTGSLVCPVVGWYELKPHPYMQGNAWIRNGGHMVTMNGVICNESGDAGPGVELRFRDPADDYYEFDLPNQSQFFSRQHDTTVVAGQFSSKKNNPQPSDFHYRSHYRLNDYAEYYDAVLPDHVAMYEGYAYIKPLGGYSTGINNIGLVTHDPNQLDYIATPPVQPHPPVQAILIADLVLDPLTREHVLLARQTNGAPDPVIRAYSAATGQVRALRHQAVAPRRAAFDRFGNLFILDGPQIVRIDRPNADDGSGPLPSGAQTPPTPVSALACDDRADVLYAYSNTSPRLYIYPRIPTAPLFPAVTPLVAPLPADPLPGEVSIAVDPRDGGVWLTSSESRSAFKYAVNPDTGAAVLADSFTHVDLLGATGLEVSRGGRLYMTKADIIAEFSRGPTGAWTRTTQTAFAGLPSGGLFRLARGRSNYTPGDVDALQIVPPIPPCARFGDLNGDGAINAADLALMLGSWGPCGLCAADLNGDGVVSAADLAIMLGAWGECDR